ncbi:proline iminopeptidase [Aplysia californica]|uniref:Proline iminopeptidase n=1 Tax=Aplysia californica TaxID=6500 RepID=A0ABM0ZZ63_APLCA|nr:proline iminopeptidase [Aplysia californica]
MMIPEFWEKLVDFLPPGERRSVLDAYYRRLTSNDPEVEREAARRWCRYEIASSSLLWTEEVVGLGDKDPDLAYQFARLDSHYAANGCFLKWDTQLLDDVEKIRHIPATIVQGRYDINCPPGSAWDLHKRWPEAELTIAPADGHSEVEPGIRTRLLDATDKYKKLLAQGQQKTIML